MKKRVIIIFICLFILALGTYIGVKSYYKSKVVDRPFSLTLDKVKLKVNEGDTLNHVIEKFSSQNIIHNKYLIKYYLKYNNISTNIIPGTYYIKKDMNLKAFIDMLSSGKVSDNLVKVTIPEGFNVEDIAHRLEENHIIAKEDFIKSVKEYKLPNYIKKSSERKYRVEGYLFPDTYDFEKGMDGDDIIDIMIERFGYVIMDIENKEGKTVDMDTLDDVITMGSIIEKEVEKDEERGKVASVFYNRIDRKMKLQSCATVLYSLGVHKEELSNEDLKINSPYNTYLVDKLPVGPICSPGRASIEAALSPNSTNYLFFISNDDGTHSFTASDKEFLKLKEARDRRIKR